MSPSWCQPIRSEPKSDVSSLSVFCPARRRAPHPPSPQYDHGEEQVPFIRFTKTIIVTVMKRSGLLQNVTHFLVLATLAGYFFAKPSEAASSEWTVVEGGELRIVAAKP